MIGNLNNRHPVNFGGVKMSNRPRIMLVSPRSDLQHLINNANLASRFDLFKVNDMDQAVSLALTSPPDLVLLDLVNPVLNGYSLLRSLKSDERTDQIPVISMITQKDSREGLNSLESGAVDYLVCPCYNWELIARLTIHLRMKDYQEELKRKNRELEDFSDLLLELNSRLEGMARKDELTHIWNRRAFNEQVENIHNYSSRYQHSYCIIMADLDNFKAFNDTYGHQAGDKTLEQLAVTLTNTCRSTDFVARLGGEEFVIVLPETGCSAVEFICERILKAVRFLHIKHEKNPGTGLVTVSLGVSEFRPLENRSETWEQVLRRADHALYAAKNSGRNRACYS